MGKVNKRARMNVRGEFLDCGNKPCVYRYIDADDGIIKYVGIVHKNSLRKRLLDHSYVDEWCKNKVWDIEYFECENRSEAEAFESHLISLYGTGRYFNKSKKTWGVNGFLPCVENKWKPANISFFADSYALQASLYVRELIRAGQTDEALKLLDCFVIEEV